MATILSLKDLRKSYEGKTGGVTEVLGGIEDIGLDVREVDVSEFRRMDGGVSCLSIRIPGSALTR